MVADRKVSLEWVRAPQQARSEQTLNRLLDAAESILDEKSFDEATVVEIVARARSSVGSFYARFADKDALLHALDERLYRESIVTIGRVAEPSNWADAPLSEVIESLVRLLVSSYRDRRGLRRALLARSRTDARFRERAARTNAAVIRALTRLLKSRPDEHRLENHAHAAEFGLLMMLGVVRESILNRDSWSGVLTTNEDAIVQDLTRAFLGYLGAEV